MAFNDIEKRTRKTFLEKQYAGARVNVEQKSDGISLKRFLIESR